jgi:ferritin-like metal-binding protein YciE
MLLAKQDYVIYYQNYVTLSKGIISTFVMRNTDYSPLKPDNMKAKNEKGSKPVKASSDAAQGLRELFEDQLKDLYWAEKALTKAMPKVIKNVTSQELVDALTYHVQLTVKQVKRLEDIFETLGKKPEAEKCEAMEGLIKEGEEIMEATEEGVVRDAGIISAVQKIEHYEIASYGTLRSFAEILGENEAASLLEETLNDPLRKLENQ